jgi:hypothetical protein
MATLREYFDRDGSNLLCIRQPLQLAQNGETVLEVLARLHLDFEANTKFVSFYIPHTDKVACPARIVLNYVGTVLNWTTTSVGTYVQRPGDQMIDGSDLRFSGRVFVYSEDPVSDEDREYIQKRSTEVGQMVIFRLGRYAEERSKAETPQGFISHDARDKDEIARPLALALQNLMCPVWYDEFSLKVGDSLRESIEKGLKECRKCIFVITPNFLANGGWAKTEYDSIFTRELVEQRKVILPIWHNVNREDVYKYSPILADRFALNWNAGSDIVAAKLRAAILS